MVESFWRIPDITALRTPLAILREQAAFLSRDSKGRLAAKVEVETFKDGKLELGLVILVAALNLRHLVLTYRQPMQMYPGVVFAGSHGVQVHDEAGFTDAVKAALRSEPMSQILTALLLQATP